MDKIVYQQFDRVHGYFLLFFIVSIALIGTGFFAAWALDHYGHWITGMDNQIVWGLPHVFAVFLIVAASGALNIATIAAIFDRSEFKPLNRVSALIAIGLLIGGLSVLVLDLGRPDRLIIAMTYYNFSSVFTWNILFYVGFLAIVTLYIWVIMDRKMAHYYSIVSLIVFFWRLALTSATGLIFGLLIAREAYDAAILAPMFIAMSFSIGLAVFYLLMRTGLFVSARPIGNYLNDRLGKLLRIFVALVFYFVVISHLTNLYASEHYGVEKFILLSGGYFTAMFWLGQILLGTIIPLILLFPIKRSISELRLIFASVFTVLGGVMQIYIIIIGGQAYPLVLFPGYTLTSTFADGLISYYIPSFFELLLGLGGFGIAIMVILIGSKILRIFPNNLEDNVIDPHYNHQ